MNQINARGDESGTTGFPNGIIGATASLRTAPLTIPDNAFTVAPLDTLEWDTYSMYDAANDRINILIEGWYDLTFGHFWGGTFTHDDTGYRELDPSVNDGEFGLQEGGAPITLAQGGFSTIYTHTEYRYLYVGDWLKGGARIDNVGTTLSHRGSVAATLIKTRARGRANARHDVTAGIDTQTLIYCKARRTTTQTITGAGANVIALPSEDYDPNNLHDNVTNNSRITVGKTTTYKIYGHVKWAASAVNGCRIAWIRHNNTTNYGVIQEPVVGTLTTDQNPCCKLQLTAGDYVELNVQKTPGATNLDVSSAELVLFECDD